MIKMASMILLRWIIITVLVKFCITSVNVNAADFLTLLEKQNLKDTSEYIDSLSSDEKLKTLETRFSNGDTALIYAARQGDLSLFNLLIKAGANPSVRDVKERDVLNIAIQLSNPELAKLAVKAGTDVTAVTSIYEGSALIYATHQGEVEIAKLLISAGAPLDRVNNLGWTALLEATILGDGGSKHQEIVKALLTVGADQSIADKNGLTPLDHAKRNNQKGMISILSSALK